jgi:hypothetical protein
VSVPPVPRAEPSPTANVLADPAPHRVAVWRYLRALGAGAAEADDLTQETMVVACRQPLPDDGEAARAFLKVTGFLGSGAKPQPISERDAARYFGGVEEAKNAPKREISVDYEIGDNVKVLDGPFASFNGLVEELDFDKSKVKVSVSIFGRATPVELDFEQVELVK